MLAQELEDEARDLVILFIEGETAGIELYALSARATASNSSIDPWFTSAGGRSALSAPSRSPSTKHARSSTTNQSFSRHDAAGSAACFRKVELRTISLPAGIISNLDKDQLLL
jgi:hypothetical protein